jgi:beta-galactosidase
MKKISAPNHAGGANWIFSDSTSGGRVSTEVARAGGEVDGVRLPKEAYYVCKTIFRDDPQVHIIGHWTYPANTKKTVYVTSNAEDVELLVNGRTLGHAKATDRFLFTFPDVVWEAGEIKAVASTGGKVVATGSKHTVGPAVALRMTPVSVEPGGLRADGSDIALVDVEAVDARGERCPTFQQRVDFETAGPAVWRGGYNSGKIKSTNNAYLDLEAGINRVSVRATRIAGAILVKASAAGLKPASITLRSAPYTGGLPAMPEPALPKTRPAPVDDTLTRTDATRTTAGKYVKSFSYSGPTGNIHVESNAQNGTNPYADSEVTIARLPESLKGADFVQAAKADRAYSAVDLMELAVPAGAVVSIAHDDRLPVPTWLAKLFQPTGESITGGGKAMSIFQHRASKEESLTLGDNATGDGKNANMYLVLVK